MGRFRSTKQPTSYCGLFGDERSSADNVMRTSLSKQRNKHIQRVLIEAVEVGSRRGVLAALVVHFAVDTVITVVRAFAF